MRRRSSLSPTAVAIATCWVLCTGPAGAQIATLTRDIVPPGLSNGSSGPNQFVALGDRAVFIAAAPGLDAELWTSDGTALGTELLLHSHPSISISSFDPELWSVSGGLLYFSVSDSLTVRDELWRTDGTREGTHRLLDSTGAVTIQTPPHVDLLAPAPGGLFFTASIGEAFQELWFTDGTPEGTRLVKDLHPTDSSRPHAPAVLGSKLYFLADDGTHGVSLWASDSTATGTVLVKSFAGRGEPYGLLAHGEKLVFFLRGSDFDELWVSSGTAASTVAVRSFPASLFPFRNPLSILGTSTRRLYFLADDGDGRQLWRTDGTRNGTVAVTAFEPDDGGDEPRVRGLAVISGQGPNPVDTLLLMVEGLEFSRLQLWRSQGTPQSNRLITTLIDYVPALVAVGNRALVRDGTPLCVKLSSIDATSPSLQPLLTECAELGETRIEFGPEIDGERIVYQDLENGEGLERRVWRTAGTPATTRRLGTFKRTTQIRGGFTPAGGSIVKAGGTFFLSGFDDAHGFEPWVSQGTPVTSRLLADLDPASDGSRPILLDTAGDRAYFSLAEGPDPEVWRSDGDPETTLPATDLAARGCTTPSPDGARVASGLLFMLTDCGVGLELWATAGSPAGMVRLTRADGDDALELVLGALAAWGERALFAARGNGVALWESDGTPSGTRGLVALDPEVQSLRHLTVVGEEIYFVATEGFGAQSVWRSDGTSAGTRRVTPIGLRFGSSLDSTPQFTHAGHRVYFVAENSSFGAEIWATDGTLAGTSVVEDLYPGYVGSDPLALTAFQGALYFSSIENGYQHRALRRLDGPFTPSYPLLEVSFGDVEWIEATESALFFARTTESQGSELWATDGTAAGTRLVKDIWPGARSARPQHARSISDRLLFSASDGVLGQELWVSDGTEAGTRIVHDIAPGPASSSPDQLTLAGSSVYFSADDGLSGRELWRLPLAPSEAGCRPTSRALCLQGGRFRVEASWRTPQGTSGEGKAVPLTADTGYFWFFNPANVEAILKVLDGRGLNGHHWVFYGALSNVDYAITVTDAATGASRRYANPSGQLASVGDTEAFGPRGASTSAYSPPPEALFRSHAPTRSERRTDKGLSGCAPSSTRLCLNQGRFAVEASWRDFQGGTGVGHAVALTADTGYFWFFRDTNVEVVLKVLDGRPVNGRFWTFYGALSNVEYTLTVTDTATGEVRIYHNPSGRFASVADVEAF